MSRKQAKKKQEEFVVVFTALGPAQADVVRGSLEAAGIPVYLEAGSQMLPLGGSGLGEVRIFVPVERAEEARRLLDAGPEGEGDEDGKTESDLGQ